MDFIYAPIIIDCRSSSNIDDTAYVLDLNQSEPAASHSNAASPVGLSQFREVDRQGASTDR